MTPERAAVLDRLAGLILAARPAHTPDPHPLRVGIDGVDTAGKTTLADELGALLAGQGRVVIRASVDDFHRPRAERHRRGPDSPLGFYHDTFDYPALRARLLDPLGPGGSQVIQTACYDLVAEAPLDPPPQTVPPDAILLCDGIFLRRPEIAACWDVHLFVQIDFAEVERRAAARDVDRFGGPGMTLARYRRRYIPGQRLYLAEANPAGRADLLLDNTDPAHPRLLRPVG